MVCVYCGGKTGVVNSRHQKRANAVWRRRQCDYCKAVFTSIEQADTEQSLAVKDDRSHIVPFLRDQLFLSIYDACRHRPDAVRDASALTTTVISKLSPYVTNGMVLTGDIRRQTLLTLRAFDQAAAVHYDAYHHT